MSVALEDLYADDLASLLTRWSRKKGFRVKYRKTKAMICCFICPSSSLKKLKSASTLNVHFSAHCHKRTL